MAYNKKTFVDNTTPAIDSTYLNGVEDELSYLDSTSDYNGTRFYPQNNDLVDINGSASGGKNYQNVVGDGSVIIRLTNSGSSTYCNIDTKSTHLNGAFVYISFKHKGSGHLTIRVSEVSNGTAITLDNDHTENAWQTYNKKLLLSGDTNLFRIGLQNQGTVDIKDLIISSSEIDYDYSVKDTAERADNVSSDLNSNFEAGQYEEITIVNEGTDGYYGYTGGDTFNPYTDVKTSVAITVPTSRVVKFTGATWSNVPALVYFDSNNHKVGTYPSSKPDATTSYYNEVVNIPLGVSYFRIQDVTGKVDETPTVVLYQSLGKRALEALYAVNLLNPISSQSDVLYGKKLVTAGDSYTRASFAGSADGKNYGYYVAQRHNMTFINEGISGSIMALSKEYIAGTESINYKKPFSYQRYLNIPADTDYLTIWFGINDKAHTNLGQITDSTNETFYGAWNVVLEYFLTNYPFMKIGLIVTTGADADYRQAVRDVAEKWGYPYLDWVNDVKIPAFFDRQGMSQTAQDLRRAAFGYNDYAAHPNPEWHEYASTIYENFLRSL